MVVSLHPGVVQRIVPGMTETTAAPSAHDPATDGGLSRWSQLASLGLVMAAAAPILLIVATLVWGLDGDDLAFFVVPAVLGIIGSVLVRRRSTALKVAAIVMAVLIAGAMFWTVFGLAAPASFFDFVPGLLVLPGVLIALVAGIASIRSSRRGDVADHATEDRAIGGIIAALGVLAVGSAAFTFLGQETVGDDEAATADLVVELKDFEFDDDDGYEVGAATTILVKNSDPLLHTFTIDALDIDITLNPGSEKLVSIPAEPGEYVLYCSPHTSDPDDPSDDDMATTLTIG